MEDRIVRLAEAGEVLAAVRVARRAYGMGVAEARAFVEGLLK